jgi:hypothetical protein|tara:strand:- start:78 stop:1310 length:1233 start_codon:yes stop_codon:yes gene_type:complete
MSSTFTTFSGQKVKGFAGKEYSVPVYLQFVPGYCIDAVHSVESLGYKGPSSINTIYAVSHVPNTTGKRRQQSFSEDNRYFPLLRNHGDIPTKGDPVLLCTIGKINYYLGPINTINNSPTWNDDLNYKKELTIQNKDVLKNTQRGERGESLNFNKEALYSRLQKIRNEDLDYGTSINEVTGDYLIEGRHGNSIRVGSRSNNPYIFISNERGRGNYSETLGDGSLITITSNGTLAQHFESYIDGIGGGEQKFGFQLSSDGVENNTYPIGDIQSDLNNGADIQDTIYGYNGNQMLLHSDRIILNSKLDDIFVSSIKDIYIGAGENLSLTSPESFNILSENVNIGNKYKATMESMVLGEALKEVLNDIISLIPSIVITTQLGPQSPMPQIQTDIQKITSKIENITSTKHKIEQG